MEISWNFVSPEKWEPCNGLPSLDILTSFQRDAKRHNMQLVNYNVII